MATQHYEGAGILISHSSFEALKSNMPVPCRRKDVPSLGWPGIRWNYFSRICSIISLWSFSCSHTENVVCHSHG